MSKQGRIIIGGVLGGIVLNTIFLLYTFSGGKPSSIGQTILTIAIVMLFFFNFKWHFDNYLTIKTLKENIKAINHRLNQQHSAICSTEDSMQIGYNDLSTLIEKTKRQLGNHWKEALDVRDRQIREDLANHFDSRRKIDETAQ